MEVGRQMGTRIATIWCLCASPSSVSRCNQPTRCNNFSVYYSF